MNKVILIGNLGADPEVRFTADGKAIATFQLATNKRYTQNGEKKDYTEWHHIVAWEKTAEIIGEHLQKGSKVAIEGELRTRDYTDKEGVKRYVTEIRVNTIEFLSSKNGKGNPAPHPADGGQRDDRIPF